MAHDHDIVAGLTESPPGLVGDWDVFECDTGLEGELGDDCEALARDQAKEWVFGLLRAGLCCCTCQLLTKNNQAGERYRNSGCLQSFWWTRYASGESGVWVGPEASYGSVWVFYM